MIQSLALVPMQKTTYVKYEVEKKNWYVLYAFLYLFINNNFKY